MRAEYTEVYEEFVVTTFLSEYFSVRLPTINPLLSTTVSYWLELKYRN
jgi:hypothetical protein